MNTTVLALWAFFGYISGSIPFGYLVARAKGVDIRKRGSGNIGGANVARNLGMRYGALVVLLDILKTFIPTYLAVLYADVFTAMIVAMFGLIGAVATPFLGFRGGKGFSAFLGGYLALVIKLNLWGPFAILFTLWISTVILTQMTGLANILTITTAIPVHALPGAEIVLTYVVFSAMVIYYTHRDNIILMLQGKLEEQRFSNKKRSLTMDKV
jgi:glycerol-3-phosphate acyltransferase PlsY